MTRFIPGGPKRYAHQTRGLRKLIETAGVGALLYEPGLGKGHPLDEPVLTPTGWRSVGDLEVGDLVIGYDGLPTEVTGVFDRGELPTYRVSFHDGASTRVDGEHLWKFSYRAAGKEWAAVQTTAELMANKRLNPKYIPMVRVSGAEADLPVDPYLLGALIADGALSGSGTSWAKNEQTVIDEVHRAVYRMPGCRISETRIDSSPVRHWTIAGLTPALRELGLKVHSTKKFIPDRYFHSSVDQRLALINGLFDGDGSVRRGRGTARYASRSERLIDDVLRLLWSLGVGATKTRVSDRRGHYWYAQVHGEFNPFRASEWRTEVTGTARVLRRSFKSIEYIGDYQIRCIKVAAEDSLYVTKDYIVTHNTATSIDFLGLLALKAQPDENGVKEVRVLVVAPKAAIDTWVRQMPLWVSPQVNYWAEAIGGDASILRRAEVLAARGGQPFEKTPGTAAKKRRRFRTIGGVKQEEPKRAEGWQYAMDWSAHSDEREILQSDGPDGLGKQKPRIVLLALNYDTFASRQRRGSKLMSDIVLEGVKRFAPHQLILDESHKIKGPTSNTSRLIDRVAQNIRRRILLTGTVMPSGPLDVFAQWRVLDPYAFGDLQPDGSVKRATLDGFKSRYAIMGGYLGHEVVGYRNLEDMQQIMSRRAVVALKKDELDLPPVIPVIVPVALSAKEKQAYQEMKKDLATKLSTGLMSSSNNRLTQMMRLRQITSGHLPDDFGNVIQIGTSKIDTIKSIVEDELPAEKRIVVFCLFRHELETLARAMKSEGNTVFSISGDTSDDERLDIRKQFGRSPEVDSRRMILVAQIRTMSLAVNELVTAQNVIFGSLSQQRDDLIQAIDRLNRIGQTGGAGGKVTVWFVEAPGTIDEVIHRSHDLRTSLESAVLAHILGEDESATHDHELNQGLQEMSDAGAQTADSHASTVLVTDDETPASDARFPGLPSEMVSDAVGIFNGEDEAPFLSAVRDVDEDESEEEDVIDLTALG